MTQCTFHGKRRGVAWRGDNNWEGKRLEHSSIIYRVQDLRNANSLTNACGSSGCEWRYKRNKASMSSYLKTWLLHGHGGDGKRIFLHIKTIVRILSKEKTNKKTLPNCVGVSLVSFVDPCSKASATPPRPHLLLLQLGHEYSSLRGRQAFESEGEGTTSSPESSRFPIWRRQERKRLLSCRRHIGKRGDPGDDVGEGNLDARLPFFLPFRTPGQAGYVYRIPPPLSGIENTSLFCSHVLPGAHVGSWFYLERTTCFPKPLPAR